MRKLYLLVAATLLCSAMSSMAIDISVGTGGGTGIAANASNDALIGAVIPSWSQVIWGQTASMDMNFAATGDWSSTTLAGSPYGVPTGIDNDKVSSVDPWAGYGGGRYYEANDSADIYVASNVGMNMTLTPNGNLSDGAGNSIPTWFTVAFTGWVNDLHYATGLGNATAVDTFGGANGSQAAFPMTGSAATWHLNSSTHELDGTVTFHVRMQRNGLADEAGTYATSLGVAFVEQ